MTDESDKRKLTVTGSTLATAAAPLVDAAGLLGGNRLSLMNMLMGSAITPWQGWQAGWEAYQSLARLNPWYVAVEKEWQRQTDAQFIEWIGREGLDVPDANGTSTGGRVYSYSKKAMMAAMNATPEPMCSFIKYQLMHNPEIQEAMRNDDMAEQFERIGTLLRDTYGDHGLLFDEKYNHKFLTEDSKGNIVAVSDEEIVKLFPQGGEKGDGKQQRFPHLILTSSHAQGETLADVTSITHGIEAMARESEGRELDIGYIDSGVKPGQTLILYSCDVRENPWLNAASLLRRINELKRAEAAGSVEADQFKDMSPGAKRIARLMLKCMVNDPSAITVNNPQRMADIGQGKLLLRPDVEDVSHHFKLDGYSKGGNVVSDAARFMVAELTAKDAQGQEVFAKHPDSPHSTLGDFTMSERNVHNIMRNIAVMPKASVEVAMAEHYKRHGVRRVSINNQHDLVSAHNNFTGSEYDERWIIKGVEHNVGHDPRHMMGMRTLVDGYDDVRGYAHDDPRVARRLKEYYASNYGKAAIGHVKFDRAAQGEIILEAATGTTDAQLGAYQQEITRAFQRSGLKHVQFTDNTEEPGIFTMKCAADFAHDPNALMKLRLAFTELLHHARGLLITQNIDEEIVAQIQQASPSAGETRSFRSRRTDEPPTAGMAR